MRKSPFHFLPMRRGFFFSLVLFGFLSTSYALNLGQIKTEIRLRIKDTSTTRQRYTDTQLLNMINQTQRDVVNFTWIVQASTSFPLVSGTTSYALPSNLIQIMRVTYSNRKLPQATMAGLDSRFNYASWQLSSGSPDSYYQDPTQSNKVSIYPFPNSSSTGTLNVLYVVTATDLSADSDVPFNGESRWTSYHDLLIYEPCYKIFLIENEQIKIAEYKNYYETRLKQIIDLIGKNPDYLSSFSGPNPR